jgi:SPP1 gp7 family putative phage head morphogenesis protein
MQNLDRPALLRILPVLHAAQREVEKDLRAWLGKHSGMTFTAARYKNALGVLGRAVHKAEIRAAVEHALKNEAKRIGPLSLHNVKREWIQLATIFEGSAQPLAIEEAAILAEGKRILWPRFASSAKRYAGRVGERTRFQIAVSRARGETIDELTRRLQAKLPHVFHGERWDAERLARTETMNAANEYHHDAIREATKDDDKLLERWDACHDGRLCVECASLDGQVTEVDEDFKAKSGARGERPPIHPACRCVLLPWRETWPTFASQSSTDTLVRAAERRAA